MAAQALTGGCALGIAVAALYLGRRDLTRPGVVFGAVWFGCVALAQLRLTGFERSWPTGFTALVFAGGLSFMLAAALAGGTRGARSSIGVRRADYRAKRLAAAALVLCAAGVAGLAYTADVLGGIPLLSGEADVVRARASRDGEVVIPAWSTALTDGFFLSMWCALAARWTLPRAAPAWARAGLWALAAVGLFGVATLASRNTILFAVLVPLVAAYVFGSRPGRGVILLGAAVVLVVVGGFYVVRVSDQRHGRETFLDREFDAQPGPLRPLVPLYVTAVYPFAAAARVYQAVPAQQSYALGAYSLLSLPDAAFPHGKPPYNDAVAAVTARDSTAGLEWVVATYQGRLYGDLGWAGVLLGSVLLGVVFGTLYRWARSHSGFVGVALVAFLAYYAAFMAYDNLLSFSLIAVFDLAVVAGLERFARSVDH